MEQTEREYVSVGKSVKKFCVCADCQFVISVGNFASRIHEAPEFIYYQQTGEIIELAKNDLADFLLAHKGHRLEKIIIIDGPLSYQPFDEPISEKYYYVEIPAGHDSRGQRVVLKSWREQIGEPLRYEIFPGLLRVWVYKVEIDFDRLAHEITTRKPDADEFAREFFISGIKSILEMEDRQIREELSYLEPLFDQGIAALSNHPLIIYLQLNDYFLSSLKYIIKSFPENDRRYFLDFVDHENKPYGLLALKVTLDFCLTNNKKEGEK